VTSPPTLFDTGLLARRRARAGRIGGADFLHRAVAGEIAERLTEVKRSFTDPVLIGPQPEVWAEALAQVGVPPPRLLPDGDVLPLAEGSHDLAVHALALHWANDPVGQLVQARRALRPDGLFLAALFGGETLGELRAALAEAEIEVSGGLSPRVAPMGEIRELGALLQRAGFALPVADVERVTVRYATVFSLMHDLRRMGATNALIERRRVPLRRATLMRMAEIYARRFADPDGRLRATFEIVWLSGWAPHESQQRPLKPGSATQRLADALGTSEISTGEKPERLR